MQYIALLAFVASLAAAQDTNAQLTALLADVKANLADYLGQISAGNAPPAALLSLVQEAQTYTDDSYTTLYSEVDMAQVSSYVTGLPWYSSRLASIIGGGAETSAEATSAAETTAAAESTAAAETTAAAESSAAAVETSSVAVSTTAVETVNEENGAAAFAPFALLALVPALL